MLTVMQMSSNPPMRFTIQCEHSGAGELRAQKTVTKLSRDRLRKRTYADFVAATLIVLGVSLVIGPLVFRVFSKPEWAWPQAASTLGPIVLAGTLALVLGWMVDRRGE